MSDSTSHDREHRHRWRHEHGPHWKPKSVAVFGAGIAGLTAAHELIERGYEVDVYEEAEPSVDETTCGIGGMARTQWTWAPTARTLLYDPPSSAVDWEVRQTQRLEDFAEARTALRTLIRFEKGKYDLEPKALAHLKKLAALLLEAEGGHDGKKWDYRLHVRGYTHENFPPLPVGSPVLETHDRKERTDNKRAIAVMCALVGFGVPFERLRNVALGLGYPDDWKWQDEDRCYVEFFIFEDLIPGEHGFRFFPAFYRNLRDTMRRTPIPERSEPYVETERTAHDNLIATTLQRFSPQTPPAYEMPRRTAKSLQELFDLIVKLFEATRYPRKDIERLKLMLFKYMTSCPERRKAEYEDISWWDFVGGEAFEERMRRHLETMPQLLVAMSARESDARSFGNITTQLLKDQCDPRSDTDGILNGPTSEAWFANWRRYLENQGVRFHRGRLTGFHHWTDDHHDELWPIADVWVKGQEDPKKRVIVRHFYVVALSAERIQEIVRNDDELTGGDFDRIRCFDLGNWHRPDPKGGLRHMAGVQYFLPADFKMVAGHSEYPDAPWRLSSVFQSQFWLRKRGWWDGYRGILSVVLCEWNEPGRYSKKTAWASTPAEIAQEVWAQVRETLPEEDQARMPWPLIFHFDQNMHPAEIDGEPGYDNKSPLMINLPGQYHERPGDPENGYCVHAPWNIVFAGTLMQTHTRMTTMEAANESARHAVNAILKADCFLGDACQIFDPEKHELDEMQLLVDLDRELLCEHLPHFIDILDLEEMPEFLQRFDGGLDGILGALNRERTHMERLQGDERRDEEPHD